MRSLLPISFALACLVSSAVAADFVVTNTNSSGPGSLAQAITATNALPGRDNILFNISGAGVHVIDASTALPEITDSVIIDGYTQPGAQPNTQAVGDNAVILIEINPQPSNGNGFVISAGASIIRGLSITGFKDFGIYLKDPGTGNTIEGNFIGLRPDGTTVLTGNTGISVGTAGNVIGGTTPAARNVISGVPDPASLGINLAGNQNTVSGNYIGTDASGMLPRAHNKGVFVFPGHRDNVIGGTASGAGNVLAGTFAAVHVSSSPTQIMGNYIGIASDGKTALKTNGIGVFANGSNNAIGGLAPGAGNAIAFSGVAGVFVWPSNQINNAILSNSIYGRPGQGIRLGDDGPHPNDNLDADDGPNHLQNFPVITSTGFSGNTMAINGTLNSTPNTPFTVQLFTDSDDYLHPRQSLLKTINVLTDNNGKAEISVGVDVSSVYGPINATATDPAGNTSEFFLRPSKPRNLSARARVEPGDNALIGGIIVDGSFSQTAQKVIVRALGPSLSVNGSPLPGRLDDPVLQIIGDPPFGISNDNWGDDPNTAAELQKYGLTPSSDRESAVVFNPGNGRNFTAVVRGKNNSSGIAVVEFYDVIGTTRHLANISARGLVRGGDNVMIGGFIVADGNGPTPFVLRAIGPSLSKFGIPNPLSDPLLELHDANGSTFLISDNWQDDPAQQSDLTAVGLAPSDPKESAMLVMLVPGAYTAVVRGNDGETGVALVEVYQLP